MTKEELRQMRIDAMGALYGLEMDNEPSDLSNEVSNIVNYYKTNKDQVDELISKSLVNYQLHRLSYVDRAIVRVCTIEMLEGLDPKIAINEALEIVKIYADEGDKKDVRFINRLLDTIKNNIK